MDNLSLPAMEPVHTSIFSLVSENRIKDVLNNLQEFTGIAIRLIDCNGKSVLSFGETTSYCTILQKEVFSREACCQLHKKAGQRAQKLGEAYIFSCHANGNHIAFPLINQGELLGTVILGPFLMDEPDNTLISELTEYSQLSGACQQTLQTELGKIPVLPPTRVNLLKKLVDNLLSPLLPGERALLLESQQKMYQQARINETIQVYKDQQPDLSLVYLYKKEKELLEKVHSGPISEVKALLNELIGYVLFNEGGRLESVRVHAIELTILLSRVAIEGGAKTDSIYTLNSQFLARLYGEQSLEDLCLLMQEVLESFMSAMFCEQDKGNPHIREALRYIAGNYSRHLDLKQVADYVHLSPSYFSSLFRQVVGVSFRQYLCSIRIEESKRLLLSSQYSIAEIAVAMGFPDQSYYCKVFKRFVGVTPGKYRL